MQQGVIMSLLVFLVFAAAINENSPDEACSMSRLYDCALTLQTVGGRFDLFATRDDMERECKQNQLEDICVENHVSACFPVEWRKTFNDTLEAVKQLKEEMCLEGPMKEAFLRHSHCYTNVFVAEGKCLPLLEAPMQQIENVNETKGICCVAENFTQCSYMTIKDSCGSEAADFLHQQMDRNSSPFHSLLCGRFTGGACSQTSSTTSSHQI